MNPRIVPPVFAAGLALLASASTVAAFNGSTTAAGASAFPNARKSVLLRGMAAAEVREILGSPETVKKMDAPGAEIWTYRRMIDHRYRFVSTGVQSVPVTAAPGSIAELQWINEPVYAVERRSVYVVIQLLMLDGKLVLAKHQQEEEASTDH